MPIGYPLINGLRFDFSSVTIRIGTQLFNGVKSLKYSQTLEPGIVRGNRSQVIGRTRGPLDSEGSIELYRSEFQDLISALVALPTAGAGALGYMEVPFDITAVYAEVGVPPITDVIVGARIKKHELSGQEGGDALTVACDLHVMSILMGGAGGVPVAPIGAKFLK